MNAKKGSPVDLSILDRLTDGFNGFLDALVQIIENPQDWGANKIVVRFYQEGSVPCIAVIDDGSGMSPESGQCEYVTLGGSAARADEEKKGRNGTGRLGFIHHCKECVTYTKIADGRAWRILMSKDLCLAAWVTRDDQLVWETVELPHKHDLTTSGTMVVWRDIRIGSRSAVSQRKPKIVIERLAELLPPSLAAKIVVQEVSERGEIEEQPLKPRKITGEAIQFTLNEAMPLGSMVVDLYVVARADRAIDHVMIGSKGPVCTWSTFAQDMLRDLRYQALTRQVDVILRHPQVVGYIDMPVLNRIYATVGRKTFSGNLLDDEELVKSILETLRLRVCPKVEKELGLRSDQIVTSNDAELVRQICTALHQGAPENRPKKRTVAHLELNRHRVQMLPGEQFTFRVEHADQNARYLWDDSGCGGTLSALTGSEVTYTAHVVGDHSLTVSMMGDEETAPVCTIRIQVRETLPMAFTQTSIHMALNDARLVRLVHVPQDADLVWTALDWEGGLIFGENRTEAELQSSNVEGVFDVVVVNQNNADEDVAVCTVTVEKDWAPKPREEVTIDNQVVVDGHTFEIMTTKLTGTADALAAVSWLQAGTDRSSIQLNFGHPLFAADNNEVRMVAAVREIACRIARRLHESEGVKRVDEAAATLTAAFLGRLRTKK